MTLGQWISEARAQLRDADVLDWWIDPEWMACEALGARRSSLGRMAGQQLLPDQASRLQAWLRRRATGEPLQYVLDNAQFMGLTVICDRRALIPRPETETLCELALNRLRGVCSPEVLDLCCGTGAIGLSIARARPDARVTLADISEGALALTAENVRVLGLTVRFALGDLFGAVPNRAFDLIACNPPYIPDGDMASLQREVKHEPELALKGGADGMDIYRRIAGELSGFLKPGGTAFFEVGMGQAESVAELMGPVGEIQIDRDLGGVMRVVTVRKGTV